MRGRARPSPSGSAVTSETRYLAADDPTGEFKVVLPRVQVGGRGAAAVHFGGSCLGASCLPLGSRGGRKVLLPCV